MGTLPDSGKSVMVAMSVERLWFLYNLTDAYREKNAGKDTKEAEEFLRKLLDHLLTAIAAATYGAPSNTFASGDN